jgi:hypothetical protein
MAKTEKFRLEPDERRLMKGEMAYVEGEPGGIKNLLTGKTKVIECTAFLTSKRFVATKKRRFLPWGPLIWFFIVLMKRKIVFQIPLASFAAIKYDKEAKHHLVFKTIDGTEYRMAWTALFAKPEKWVQAIGDAIVAARPDTRAQTTPDAVEFIKP